MNKLNAKPKYRAYTAKNINTIPQFKMLTSEQSTAIRAVSKVLPFRVNNYVVEELIDWTNIPMDPIFQLTFPQEGMLPARDFARIHELEQREAPGEEVDQAVAEIRTRMNPHPAGQMEQNVPVMDGHPQRGMQHKYGKRSFSFPARVRPATPIALIVFDGPSLSVWTN